MRTNEVVKYIQENDTDDDASDLLFCLGINAEKRFEKACSMLGKLLSDIKKTYPDANYVVDNNSVSLLLGNSHSIPESAEGSALPRYLLERKNVEVIAGRHTVIGMYKCLE